MKKLVIMMVLNTTLLAAQDSLSGFPEINSKIISYCMKNVGKKVGKGICLELVDSALVYSGQKTFYNVCMDEIDPNKTEILPGDLILFYDTKFEDGKHAKAHIAIIYDVYYNGIMNIAEQNVKTSWLFHKKRNKVIISRLDLSTLISGEVYIYRAVPTHSTCSK